MFFLFFFFFSLLACRTRRSRVGAVSEPRRSRVGEPKKKKKKRDTAGHRNPARRTRSGVGHVSDTDTTPKMACPCNLVNKMAFPAFLLIALSARMMSTTFSFAFSLMALLGLSSLAVSLAKHSAIRSHWSMAGGPGQKPAWDRNKTLRERNGG